MSRKKLQIDIETFSDVDLVNCGVYRYIEGDAILRQSGDPGTPARCDY